MMGIIVAPTLFSTLPDKQLAGMVAGKMFVLLAYVGMVSSIYLLIHRLAQFGSTALKQWFFWAAFIMLLLTLAGHFGIQPILVKLKAQALPADVMQSVFASRFKAWHGVSSIAYLFECILGVVLVLKAK